MTADVMPSGHPDSVEARARKTSSTIVGGRVAHTSMILYRKVYIHKDITNETLKSLEDVRETHPLYHVALISSIEQLRLSVSNVPRL